MREESSEEKLGEKKPECERADVAFFIGLLLWSNVGGDAAWSAVQW